MTDRIDHKVVRQLGSNVIATFYFDIDIVAVIFCGRKKIEDPQGSHGSVIDIFFERYVFVVGVSTTQATFFPRFEGPAKGRLVVYIGPLKIGGIGIRYIVRNYILSHQIYTHGAM
jgi:hypothetical protein